MNHKLKIKPEYMQNLLEGIKKAEIRYNDRDYQLGDTLEFWDVEHRFVWFEITHIHSGLGLQDGYIVLSVKKVSKP
jgi:ASC-1-like (ASCH) protein